MTISTVVKFDRDEASAGLEVLVDGLPVTVYTFEQGAMSISSQDHVQVFDTADWARFLKDVALFRSQIQERYSPVHTLAGEIQIRLKRSDNGKIACSIELGEDSMTDFMWSPVTNLITFEPRPAKSFTWSDFDEWWHALDYSLAFIRRVG